MKRLLVLLMLLITVFSFGKNKNAHNWTNYDMDSKWVVGDYFELPVDVDLFDTYMNYTEYFKDGDEQKILMFRYNTDYYGVYMTLILPQFFTEEDCANITTFKVQIGDYTFPEHNIALTGELYYSNHILNLMAGPEDMELIIDGLSKGKNLHIFIMSESGIKTAFDSMDLTFKSKFIEAFDKYKEFEISHPVVYKYLNGDDLSNGVIKGEVE